MKVKDVMETAAINQMVEIRDADCNLIWKADCLGTWPRYGDRTVETICATGGVIVLILEER